MSAARSPYEKMLAGDLHGSIDPEIGGKMAEAAEKMVAYNRILPTDMPALLQALSKIVHPDSRPAYVKPPFYFEFGSHIRFGFQNFVNMNCTFLDSGEITIGDFTAIGPNCQFISVTHPVPFAERMAPAEGLPFPKMPMSYTRPITIGSKCWIGAGVTVQPGVTIGDGAVIGSGSVVTKDIPENVVAVGSPCRVVREIDQDLEG